MSRYSVVKFAWRFYVGTVIAFPIVGAVEALYKKDSIVRGFVWGAMAGISWPILAPILINNSLPMINEKFNGSLLEKSRRHD